MQEQLLQDTIEQTLKKLEQDTDLKINYEIQVDILLNNRETIEQFYKTTKDYENIQFSIREVTPPDLISITGKYMGTGIITITISKDKTIVTTEEYNKSNKELFNCELQLKDDELNSINTSRFLNYFKRRY